MAYCSCCGGCWSHGSKGTIPCAHRRMCNFPLCRVKEVLQIRVLGCPRGVHSAENGTCSIQVKAVAHQDKKGCAYACALACACACVWVRVCLCAYVLSGYDAMTSKMNGEDS